MNFTAKDVQTLREKTGVGMMDCKKALASADGDMDKAIDFLREKGLAAAAKKSGRIAAEGIVYTYYDDDAKCGIMVEVNSETDFVAKNEEFQSFVKNVAKTVAVSNPADLDALAAEKLYGSDRTVAENLQDKILSIGENQKIRRFARMDGVVSTYIHGMGRIGVMVQFETTPEVAAKPEFAEYGKDVAMQIAAINPLFLNKESVSAETLEHEKKIMTEQVLAEGKPAAIADKIVAGKINKYYKENCLVEQVFVKNNDLTIAGYTAETAKNLGGEIVIKAFLRFEKGEGLEKKSDNFADEVASMIK